MIVLIMGIITIVNGYVRSYIKTYHVQGRDNSFVRNLIHYSHILILFILLGSDWLTCSYIRSTLKLSSFLLVFLTFVLALIVIILVLYLIVIIFITCQPRSKPWGILARQTYLDSYPRNLGPNIGRVLLEVVVEFSCMGGSLESSPTTGAQGPTDCVGGGISGVGDDDELIDWVSWLLTSVILLVYKLLCTKTKFKRQIRQVWRTYRLAELRNTSIMSLNSEHAQKANDANHTTSTNRCKPDIAVNTSIMYHPL